MGVGTGASMAYATLERLERQGKLEEGLRYEVLDGELVVRGAPSARHGEAVSVIAAHFDEWSQEHGGEVYTGAGIEIDGQQLMPDLSFIGPDRLDAMDDDELAADEFHVAPDLVVEVTSPGSSSLDHVEKHGLYQRLGVAEYWVVDVAAGLVVVHRRGSAGAFEASEHTSGTLTTEQAAGLKLPLAELFAAG